METNEKGTFLSNWKSPQKLLSGFLFCRNRPQCDSLILITVQKTNLFPKSKSTKVSLLRQIAADPWREAGDNGDDLRFYLVSLVPGVSY